MKSFLSNIAKLSNTAKLSLLVSVLLIGAIGVTINSSRTKQEVRSHAQAGDAEAGEGGMAGDVSGGGPGGDTGPGGIDSSSGGISGGGGGISGEMTDSGLPGENDPSEGSQDTGGDDDSNIPGGGHCIGSCPINPPAAQRQVGIGTIILRAIIDGVDTRMDVNVDYCAPRPEGCHFNSIASTGTYQNVPTGIYSILKVIPPPALAFTGFYECGGSITACSQTLHAGETLTFNLNYHQVGSGTVYLSATLNGNPLPATVLNLHYTYPLGFGDIDQSFPATVGGNPTGIYTLEYNSGGPPGAIFAGIDSGNSTCKITRTCSQVLRASSAITFIYRFKSQGAQIHSVVPQTSGQNNNFIQELYNNLTQWLTGSTSH